jgi:hypothetical protein
VYNETFCSALLHHSRVIDSVALIAIAASGLFLRIKSHIRARWIMVYLLSACATYILVVAALSLFFSVRIRMESVIT